MMCSNDTIFRLVNSTHLFEILTHYANLTRDNKGADLPMSLATPCLRLWVRTIFLVLLRGLKNVFKIIKFVQSLLTKSEKLAEDYSSRKQN